MSENKEVQVTKEEVPATGTAERTRNRRVYRPAVDIYDRKHEFVLYADMPGVDASGVNVEFENGVLTLTGKPEEAHLEDRELVYAEYEVGDYQRAFELSEDIDVAGIKATVRNGVLKLVLPKVEAAKPRKITVAVG